MSEEIYINNGTSFQQPYIARNTVNSQTPVIGQTPSQQPTVGRSPFTYQERAPSTYRNPTLKAVHSTTALSVHLTLVASP